MAGDTSNGVTLVIDADTARYIAQISKAAKATEGLGKKGGDATREITKEMTRSLLKVVSLKAVVEGLTRSYVEASKAAANLSRQTSGQRQGMMTSLATLGVHDVSGGVDAIRHMGGGTTLEQRGAFVEGMAGAFVDEKSGSMSVNKNQVYELANAYSRGGDVLFGKGGKNLIEAAQTTGSTDEAVREVLGRRLGIGKDSKDPIADAMKKLGLDENMNMAATEYETIADVDTADAGGQKGIRARVVEATQKMRRANRPGRYLFSDTVGAIIPGADSAIEAGNIMVIGEQIDRSNSILTDIGRTLERMESNRAPMLQAGGESAP